MGNEAPSLSHVRGYFDRLGNDDLTAPDGIITIREISGRRSRRVQNVRRTASRGVERLHFHEGLEELCRL
jgi:hypothetical protein